MKYLKYIVIFLLLFPTVTLAATAAPWSITNLTDTFISPNLINGAAKGILVSASSTINSTLSVSSLTSGRCLQAGAGGLLTTTGTACASAISIPVSIANGGTATTSAITNGVYYFNGTNAEADNFLTWIPSSGNNVFAIRPDSADATLRGSVQLIGGRATFGYNGARNIFFNAGFSGDGFRLTVNGNSLPSFIVPSTGNTVASFQGQSGDYSRVESDSPLGSSNPESSFTTVVVPQEGGTRYVDWDNNSAVSAKLVTITEGLTGGAFPVPFGVQFCDITVPSCTLRYVSMPNGTNAFDISATSSIDQTSALQVASTTAQTIFEADTFSGNHIFAVRSSGATTTKLTISGINGSNQLLQADTNGNVSGSGITPFSLPLSISNGGNATTTFQDKGILFYNNTLGTISQAGNGLFNYDYNNSRLGIGTTTPLDALDIDGGNIGMTQTTNGQFLLRDGNIATTLSFDFPELTNNAGLVRLFRTTNNAGNDSFQILKGDNTNTTQDSFSSNGKTLLNQITGNVGISATSTPGGLLSIAGSAGGTTPLWLVSSSTAAFATTTALIMDKNGLVGIASSSPGTLLSGGNNSTQFFNISNLATSTFGAGGLNILSGCYAVNGTCLSTGGSGTVTSVATDATLTGGPITTTGTLGLNLGNSNTWTATQKFNTPLGIGTSSPFAMLSVSTSTQSSPTTSLFAVASTTNANLFDVLGNGQILIGTSTSLTNSLFTQVASATNMNTAAATSNQSSIVQFNINGTDGAVESNDFRMINTTSASILAGRLGVANMIHTSGSETGDMYFTLNNSGTIGEKMRLTGAGNLGIGTTSPFAQLSVVGTNTALFAIATSTAAVSSNPLLEIDNTGHVVTAGPKPTLSACGTTNSLSGNDENGTIMFTGTLVTACTLNFANPVKTGATVECLESDNSLAATGDVSATTTSSVTFGFSAGLASGAIYYQCIEHVNN